MIRPDFIAPVFEAVRKAADEIMAVYENDFSVQLKEDKSPVTKADLLSSEILFDVLTKTNITVVSEESKIPDYARRTLEEYIWLVDPLDGTKEFIKRNGEFCINIALIQNQQPIFGLIADPVNQKILYGGISTGIFCQSLQEKKIFSPDFIVRPKNNQKSRGLIFSRSHFTNEVSVLVNKLEERYGLLRLIKKGSALKFFNLVEGDAHFYPRMAPTMEWDIAAGDAIYRAVGGEVLDFTNFEPIRYNKEDLRNPNFIAKPANLKID